MNIPPRLKKSEGSDVDNHDNTTIVEPESEAVDDEVIFNFKPSLLRQQNEQLHVKTSVSKEKKVAHSQNYKMSNKSKCKFPVLSSKFKPSTCSKFSKNSCVTEVKNGSKPSLVYSIKRNNIQYKGCPSSASDCEMYTTTKLCEGQNQSSDGSAMSETSRKSRSEKKKARKLYKLRSRSQSLELKQHRETDNKPSSVSLKSEKLMTFKEGDLENLDSSSECDSSDYGDGPPGDDVSEVAKPILMKIHTDSVSKCRTDDGKEFGLEDIVWGKVKGFPWWPGRIMAINVSSKDSGVVIRQTAQVAWFGSSTMSHIECCDLYQFLEDFEAKYDRKKKSKSYQRALKQASIAAKCYQTGDLVDLNDLELDSIG
ncbi:hypothetical protein DPMN_165148 [Dreissena polymorpha]|uniref:PWWP domain-containing protein n=2 Tax=Dreissena polymorpha TaxID=45954 RepID=A0A9D4EU78_DREPO|nr:hypothetical protein DPMN_165148 [Dreissena polymorpha]